MVRASKDAFRIVLGIALGLMVVLPLFAQDPGATATGEQADKKVPEPIDIPLAFPDEKLTAPSDGLSAERILASCREFLSSGTEIKDLQWSTLHKHYRKKNNLHFVEKYEAFVDEGEDQPRVRVDYLNYIEAETNRDYYIDFREIYGEDGPFKYREGSIIRVLDAIVEAGHHTMKIYVMILAPFCSLLSESDLKYEGICSWSEKVGETEVTHRCHKIVTTFDDHRIRIRENLVALYIDTETFDLKRLVYRPGADKEKLVNRLRIIDYKERVEVDSVQLPKNIVSYDYWKLDKQATHKYTFDNYSLNKGLEGIAFGMTNQVPRPRILRTD